MRNVALLLAVLGILALVWRLSLDRTSGGVERDARPNAQEQRSAASSALDESSAATTTSDSRESILAPHSPAPRATIAVRVVERESGAPVPGAVVQWFWFETRDEDVLRRVRDLYALDGVFDELGERAVADAGGWVRVERGVGQLAMVGRAPGLFAQTAMIGDAPGELRLELQPDASIHVRLVDAEGAPAEGVPVGLRSVRAFWGGDEVGQTRTDADGRATIPHALRNWRENGEPVIAVLALLREPLHQLIDAQHLPSEPVELRLPPTGSLEVIARTADGEFARDQFVQVRLEGENSAGPANGGYLVVATAPLTNGRALVPHVGLGLRLLVDVGPYPYKSPSTRVAGPEIAGERRSVEVEVAARSDFDGTALRLRALDERGEPLRRTELDVSMPPPNAGPLGHSQRARTDENGFFDVPLQERSASRHSPRVLRVREDRGADQPVREGVRPIDYKYANGVHELGDIVLEPAPLIAAGGVFEADGSPAVGAKVGVGLALPVERASEWQGTTISTYAAADGSFALYGEVPPGRLRVHANHDYPRTARVGCEPGTSGLQLVFRGGTIAGRILGDAALRREHLQIVARLDAAEDGRELTEQDRTWRDSSSRADGSFVFNECEPGLWSLEVRTTGLVQPLRTIAGIPVLAGRRAGDPRLDPIDLRAALRHAVIELVRPTDEDEAYAFAHWEWGETGSTRMGWQRAGPLGPFELPIADTPMDVTCSVSGYRTVRLVAVDGDRRVELVPGIPVRVRLPRGVQKLPGPYRLKARIPVPAVPYPVGLGFDEHGEVSFRAGDPGGFVVKLVLEHEPAAGEEGVKLARSTRIEVVESDDEQVFELDVTQAELDDAVNRLLAQPQPPR